MPNLQSTCNSSEYAFQNVDSVFLHHSRQLAEKLAIVFSETSAWQSTLAIYVNYFPVVQYSMHAR